MNSGSRTLPQHVAAVALAAAPAVLLLGNYIPDLSFTTSVSMAAVIHYVGRVVALIGLVWCLLLLVKTMATAHGFGLWKSVGIVALTWAVMYVLAPIALFLATGYILG